MSKKQDQSGDYWYDYLDINNLLVERSKQQQGRFYEVIEATATDNLQILQRVSEAFAILNNPECLNIVVIPINLGINIDEAWIGSHWVGIVIKKVQNSFKAFYNDPFGTSMEISFPRLKGKEFSTLKQILINHGVPVDNIIDLQTCQQFNHYDCGPLTVFNLDSLATTEPERLQDVDKEDIVKQRISLSLNPRKIDDSSAFNVGTAKSLTKTLIGINSNISSDFKKSTTITKELEQIQKFQNIYKTAVHIMKHNNIINPVINKILENIEEGERLIREKDIKKNIVIVIGNTGVGKGTLINYINGVKLKATKNRDGKITLKPGADASCLPNITISDSTDTSDTFYPGVYTPQTKDNNNEEYSYIDCPGFGDTRGSEHDIANAYFRNAVTRNINKLKIVVVISYNDLVGPEGRGQFLFKVIKDLSRFLGFTESPENMEKIKDSISLIITRVENNNNEILELNKQIRKKTIDLEKFQKLFAIELADEIEELDQEISSLSQKLKSLESKDSPKEIIKRKLLEFIAENKEKDKKEGGEQKFTSSERGLIDYLANNERFEIFSQSKEEVDNICTNEKEVILDLIVTKTKYTAKSEIKVCITVSDESRLKIKDLATEVNGNICEQVTEIINRLVKISKREIKNSSDYKNIEKFFDSTLKQLDIILQTKEKEDFLAAIKVLVEIKEFEQTDIKENSNDIEKNLEYLSFFETIESNEELDSIAASSKAFTGISRLNDWKAGLRDITEELRKLTEIESNISNNILTLRGKIINTSQAIKQIIGNSKEKIQEINIYSLNTVFFNANLQTEALKGMNLNIIAPRWKIVGNKKIIDISGIEAKQHDVSKVLIKYTKPQGTKNDGSGIDGIRGAPGAPGNPGCNGGNFFGIGQEFKDLDKLVINVSGGKGGSGQIGGDGANGGDSAVDGNKQHVVKRYTSQLIEISLVNLENTANIRTLEKYCSEGKKGGKGGDSGRGGIGGIGGYPGNLMLSQNFIIDAKPKIICKNGAKGEDGAPGKVGKGGKSGLIYYGEYVNEKVETTTVLKNVGKVGLGAIGLIGGTTTALLGVVLGGAGMIVSLVAPVVTAVGSNAGALGLAGAGTPGTLGLTAAGAAGAALSQNPTVNKVLEKFFDLSKWGLDKAKKSATLMKLAGSKVGESIYGAVKHSGWQRAIEELDPHSANGNILTEKNILGIKLPILDNVKIDQKKIITFYQNYQSEQIDNPFVVKKFKLDKTNCVVELKENPQEQEKQDIDKYKKLLAMQEAEINQAEIIRNDYKKSSNDKFQNAFMQSENSNYSYKLKDLQIIQNILMKRHAKYFTVSRPLGGNSSVDNIFNVLMQEIKDDKPIIGIFSKDNLYWNNIAVLKNEDKIIILKKTSASMDSNNDNLFIQYFYLLDPRLREYITLLINTEEVEQDEEDYGIMALKNMQIMVEELKKNKAEFIKKFQDYKNFCKKEDILSLRLEFAKKYVIGVYEDIKENIYKQKLLTLVQKYHRKEVNELKDILQNSDLQTKIFEEKIAIKYLASGADINAYLNEIKQDKISKTIVIEVEITDFNKENKTYEYCYKISWTKDLTYVPNVNFSKIQKCFENNPNIEIKEDMDLDFIVKIIPQQHIKSISHKKLTIDFSHNKAELKAQLYKQIEIENDSRLKGVIDKIIAVEEGITTQISLDENSINKDLVQEKLKNKEAIKLNSEGLTLYQNIDFKSANKKFNKAIKTTTNEEEKVQYYINLSNSYIGLRNHEKALKSVEAALEIMFDYHPLLNQKAKIFNIQGLTLYRKNKFESAIDRFNKAIETTTDIKEKIKYCINISNSYIGQKNPNYQKALEAVELGFKIKPDDNFLQIQKHSIIAHKKTGDEKKSKIEIEKNAAKEQISSEELNKKIKEYKEVLENLIEEPKTYEDYEKILNTIDLDIQVKKLLFTMHVNKISKSKQEQIPNNEPQLSAKHSAGELTKSLEDFNNLLETLTQCSMINSGSSYEEILLLEECGDLSSQVKQSLFTQHINYLIGEKDKLTVIIPDINLSGQDSPAEEVSSDNIS